jgi:hypothetical protein
VDVFLDGVNVFRIFLDRIGVVIAQVCQTSVTLRDAKVDGERLGVPDVQVTLGSGGKRVCTRPPKRPLRLCSSMISVIKFALSSIWHPSLL